MRRHRMANHRRLMRAVAYSLACSRRRERWEAALWHLADRFQEWANPAGPSILVLGDNGWQWSAAERMLAASLKATHAMPSMGWPYGEWRRPGEKPTAKGVVSKWKGKKRYRRGKHSRGFLP